MKEMNELKEAGVEFIDNEYIADGHEDWIIRLMSGKPVEFHHSVNEFKIIDTLNRNYLGIYKVIITGVTARVVIFEDWEIIEINTDDPYFADEVWTYEAARAEYDAIHNNDDEE
jgi:hypothetical protein